MDTVALPDMIFRYEGEFDFQGLYSAITDFFWSRNYDVWEPQWKEKDATPIGREVTVKLTTKLKITEYVRYIYKIQWKSMDFHHVGENKVFARFWLRLEPTMKVDWQNIGSKQRFFERFYEGWLVQRELDDVYEDNLLAESQEFLDMISDFLGCDL